MIKILSILIVLGAIGWVGVYAMATPYLDKEDSSFLISELDQVCVQTSECTLVTDNYAGCTERHTVNKTKAWHYEFVTFYRNVRDTVLRKTPEETECEPVKEGLPVCEENICILDPNAESTFF